MTTSPINGLETPPWTIKALTRIGLIGLIAVFGIPMQMLVNRFVSGRTHVIPLLFHRAICRLLGLRVMVEGTPPGLHEKTLIVANHVSWLDIPVIGALRPVSFIAKSEVAGWPGIGALAKLQRTIFIDRSRRSQTATIASEMGVRLTGGDCVVLFAEGTTGDGTRIQLLDIAVVAKVKAHGVEPGDRLRVKLVATDVEKRTVQFERVS